MVCLPRTAVLFTFTICLSLSAIYLVDGRQKRVQANNINRTCRNMIWFDKRQQRLCNRLPFMIGTIRNGVERGLQQCRELFKWRRWNCSPLTWTQVFLEGGILKQRSRETALVQALSAAGVMRELAIDCRKGKLKSCACDVPTAKKRRNNNKWEWGGCGDNFKFGGSFTRRFMDPSKVNNHARKTEVHNHEVGRRIVRDNIEKKCKCHGTSQSCALKTCWRIVPEMDKIGKILHERFKQSVKTRWDKQADFLLDRTRSKRNKKVKITPDQLSFFADSEDFCSPNQNMGIMGTSGRVCNQTSTGRDSCSHLCCGRPHRTTFTEVEEKCNCRFVWCCKVECDTCKVKRYIDTCT